MNGPGSTGRTEKRPRRTPRSSPRRSRRGYRRPAPRCRGRAGAAPRRGPARDAAGAHTGSSQRAGPGAAGQSRPRTWKGLSGSTAGPPCWAMAAPGPGAEPPPSPPRLTAPRRRLAAAPTTSPAPLGAPESRTAGRPAHARGRAESGEQVTRSRGRSHVEERTLPPTSGLAAVSSARGPLGARPHGNAVSMATARRGLHGNRQRDPAASRTPRGPLRDARPTQQGPARAQSRSLLRVSELRWTPRSERGGPGGAPSSRTVTPGGPQPRGGTEEQRWAPKDAKGARRNGWSTICVGNRTRSLLQQQHSSARSCLHPLGTAEPHTATDPTLQPPPSGLPSGLGRCSAFCVLLFTLG